jgi:hypothetical protein
MGAMRAQSSEHARAAILDHHIPAAALLVKENALMLPALVEAGVDLHTLLADTHHLLGG